MGTTSVGPTASDGGSDWRAGVDGRGRRRAGEDEDVELARKQSERVHCDGGREQALDYYSGARARYRTYLNLSLSLFSARRCSLNTQLSTIALPEHAIHIPYEYRYVGPQFAGQTYLSMQCPKQSPTAQRSTHDPAIFPNCANALINDRHTARFDGGRGNELSIHAYITAYPAYDWAMRKLSQHIFSAIPLK